MSLDESVDSARYHYLVAFAYLRENNYVEAFKRFVEKRN